MKQKKSLVRINKFIADAGLASRRKAEDLILEGSVRLNGHVVTDLSTRVDPEKDSVKIGRKLIKPVTKKLYFAFHKPKGVLTAMSDEEGRPTIADFFESVPERVFPVGRLDWDTEGLLLITNDGEFANSVAHPSKEIPKTYLAKVDGNITEAKLEKLQRGVSIVGGKVKALLAERMHRKTSDKYEWVKIVIAEGKNRQVRRMFEKIGCDVLKLQRVAIGRLTIGKLRRGEFAQLRENQLEKIFSASVKKTAKTASGRNKKYPKRDRRPKSKKIKEAKTQKEFFKKVRRKSNKS